MEIENKVTGTVKFGALSVGDVFIWDGDVYMVIEQDYGLGNGRSYVGYAIELKTGCIYGFDNEECIKVSAKMTITD